MFYLVPPRDRHACRLIKLLKPWKEEESDEEGSEGEEEGGEAGPSMGQQVRRGLEQAWPSGVVAMDAYWLLGKPLSVPQMPLCCYLVQFISPCCSPCWPSTTSCRASCARHNLQPSYFFPAAGGRADHRPPAAAHARGGRQALVVLGQGPWLQMLATPGLPMCPPVPPAWLRTKPVPAVWKALGMK